MVGPDNRNEHGPMSVSSRRNVFQLQLNCSHVHVVHHRYGSIGDPMDTGRAKQE